MKMQFVLDVLDQALHARRPDKGQLIHHSDRGVQYVSIAYTQRLADAGIACSVGSVGDSYDNALTETIIGLFKAEVIDRRAWRNREAVELATLEWVNWFNHKRCWGRSAISRQRKPDPTTIGNKRVWPKRPDSNERVSGKLGAVHSASGVGSAN